MPLDPVVAQLAVESKANIERANKRLEVMDIDQALVGSGRRIFNWLTGTSGARST
jgi:hypothetical protein